MQDAKETKNKSQKIKILSVSKADLSIVKEPISSIDKADAKDVKDVKPDKAIKANKIVPVDIAGPAGPSVEKKQVLYGKHKLFNNGQKFTIDKLVEEMSCKFGGPECLPKLGMTNDFKVESTLSKHKNNLQYLQDLWCQNCMEPFQIVLKPGNPLVFICDTMNDDLKEYSLSGMFCSLSCCACFIKIQNTHDTPVILANTGVWYREYIKRWFNGDNERIQICCYDPPKQSPFESLKKFGGPMTIQEYNRLQN